MFEWKDEYSNGISTIDEQHKKLFSLISELYDIVSLKDDADHYDEILAIFKELSDYTEYHFGYEEDLLEKNDFNAFELKLHKLEHKSFINKISSKDESDIDENQKAVSMDIIFFAAKWIEDHILGTDKKYCEYLLSKGVV